MEEINKISKDTPIVMFTYQQLEEHLMEDLTERLTAGLTERLKETLFPQPLLDLLGKYVEVEEQKSKRYEHGVAGIKRIFNCSYPTAHKLMNTIIKPAVLRQGRLIMVDVDLALKLFHESKTVNSIKDNK